MDLLSIPAIVWLPSCAIRLVVPINSFQYESRAMSYEDLEVARKIALQKIRL
jgi:hypothetical protein